MKQRLGKLGMICAASLIALSAASCGSSSRSNYAQASSAPASAEYYAVEEAVENYSTEAPASAPASAEYAAMDEAAENYPMETPSMEAASSVEGGTVESTMPTKPQGNRKLIRTVYLQMQTKNYDGLISSVGSEISSLGGYVQNSELNGSANDEQSQRRAYIEARIPADKVDGFTNRMAELGNIVSRQDSTEDVTLNYVDVESHKKTLQIEQERLLALLEQAEKLEDIIALESRLSEVRYQLESYESQLRTYDDRVEYATVTMSIYEVDRVTPVENKTLGSRMSNGFQQSLYDIGRLAENLLVLFVVNLPYLLILAVIVLVVLLVIRLIFKMERKRSPVPKNWRENPLPAAGNPISYGVPPVRPAPPAHPAPPAPHPENRQEPQETKPAPQDNPRE